MKPEELITDAAIEIVFAGTNFGITPREIIAEDLNNVNNGYAIGRTASICLCELGLIDNPVPRQYFVTPLGKKYLDLLNEYN